MKYFNRLIICLITGIVVGTFSISSMNYSIEFSTVYGLLTFIGLMIISKLEGC